MTVVPVPARTLSRLQRAVDLPFALCPVDAAVADGAVVALADRAGQRLALAVVDREAGAVRVMADGVVDALDVVWAGRRLDQARALRDAHGLSGPDAAYRLLNGAGDLVPGVIADVYGAFAVVAALSAAMVPVATTLAEALVGRGDVRGAIVKHRGRGRVTGPVPLTVHGETPPERLAVGEGRLRFEVHLAAGVNVGLFTDMREERPVVARLAHGRRVLNLFAYTGAFSVAALAGGAAHVTSVDLSEGVLAWARDHVALNGLDSARHTTIAADVSQYLAAAAARGDTFDLVLVDPPSYSAARQAPFAIDRDYPAVLEAACRLLAPGGDLWAASNTRGFALVGAVHAAVPASRRPRLVRLGGLPADYPTEPSDVEARYLQTCLLRLI